MEMYTQNKLPGFSLSSLEYLKILNCPIHKAHLALKFLRFILYALLIKA